MHLPILPLLPNLRKKNINLLCRPTQHSRPQRHCQPLQTIQHRHKLERARLAHLRVCRPRADRDLKPPDLHVDETSVAHLIGEVVAADAQKEVQFVDAGFAEVAPFLDGAVGGEGGVVCQGLEGHFLGFDPAAGFEVSAAASMKLSGGNGEDGCRFT